MTSLIDKIELLIKREKTTPDKKKNDDTNKSSNEILSELFGAFNATPPVIDETLVTSKKSKKSKKKHKKEKKKRSRSSSSSDSDASEYNRKRKKKKSKHKKRKHSDRDDSPPRKIKIDPELLLIKPESLILEKVKEEAVVKTEKVDQRKLTIKLEDDVSTQPVTLNIDASSIPMPDSPKEKLDSNDLRNKLDNKGKIQIKNLKFSTVFEETVKKAEEEARKKAEKFEDGEYTDSSSSSAVEEVTNSEFPKSADPGGILKKNAEDKLSEDERTKKKHSERSSRKERERSRKRSRSRSHRSRSGSRHRSRRRRSTSRGVSRRSSSRSRRHRSRGSRERHRSRSTSRTRSRFWGRHPSPSDRRRPRRSRSPTGVRLADSEKKRLLEVARRNAINMLKNGAVPAGAAALPPHTRSQVMAAIQSGGKSVDELTDFCKHLSKKEALGELSSHSSNGSDMSENEDTLAFHHPFLVKEKAPIVMNIRGGAPLPVKSAIVPIANKEELRLQFPVSSGSQHREKAIEWRPVSPKKDDMQVAKLNAKPVKPVPAPVPPPVKEPEPQKTLTAALAAPPPTPPVLAPFMPPPPQPPLAITGVPAPLALPAPGPQAYPPGIRPPKPDISSIVSEKLLMIRKAQEENEISNSRGLGWSSRETRTLGQFTGSTGAQILTPRELASGTQAWAKKDQLTRAAPVLGGMGMHLLQKMGWTPGKGLGKEETGTLQPLLLEVKLDTRGLQAKEEAAKKGMKAQRGPLQRRPGGPPAPLAAGGKHPVSLLGEYCSKNKLGPPEYDLCFECGPDHKKNFLFKVKVAGTEYQPAVASINKKQAKADAAQLALQKLGILP